MRLDHLLYRENHLHESGQPNPDCLNISFWLFWYQQNYGLKSEYDYGSVVQLVRMSLWYSEGRRFEFFLTHQFFRWGWNQKWEIIFDSRCSKNIFGICFYSKYIVNRFLCRKLDRKIWFVEHRNLKIFFLKSNHESDNSIKESKNQLKCLKNSFQVSFKIILKTFSSSIR